MSGFDVPVEAVIACVERAAFKPFDFAVDKVVIAHGVPFLIPCHAFGDVCPKCLCILDGFGILRLICFETADVRCTDGVSRLRGWKNVGGHE